MKKLTVKDIAEKAGVSVTAVSFALNDKPGVSEVTRQKIKKIIEETEFKPNLASKKLALKKSFNICLMMNAFSSPFEDLFYFEITRGIIARSMKCGYNVIISKPIMNQTELPDLVYSGDADGIIFMQDISPILLEKAKKSGVPFVVVDSHSNKKEITSISPDYKKATYDATSYLIKRGHTDIALISSSLVADFKEQTISGFLEAMKEHGITPKPEFTNISVASEDSAYFVTKDILNAKHRPSAILCTVDSFAIGAIRCAKRDMKLSVPDDLSVMGIDDILLSRYINPTLTTMGIDKVGIGSMAMDMIVRKINGEDVESVSLQLNLIERNSVRDI